METTRHFVNAVYVVEGDAVALHDHKRLDMWLPAGGHIQRDELPNHSALREVEEEMGLEVSLVHDTPTVDSSILAEPLPQPQHIMLEDINSNEDGEVGHQHIDLVYYATANTREIDPAGDDEVGPEAWNWFTKDELEQQRDDPRFEADTLSIATEAIEIVQQQGGR